jgi:rhodanese-related sulfurtransferase
MPVSEVDVEEFARQYASGGRLIDVREPDEYLNGHVPGAILVPMATVPDRLDEFTGEGPTFVICLSGARSRRVAEWLADRGTDVVNVDGGTRGWILSGRDVVAGDAPGEPPR